jgi:hypothetical protein
MIYGFGKVVTLLGIINFILILKAVHQITDILSHILEQYGIYMTYLQLLAVRLTLHYMTHLAMCYVRRRYDAFVDQIRWCSDGVESDEGEGDDDNTVSDAEGSEAEGEARLMFINAIKESPVWKQFTGDHTIGEVEAAELCGCKLHELTHRP